MPFPATWMDLQIIILSEVKSKTNATWYHSYVEYNFFLKSDISELIQKTETDLQILETN